jgi:hypothetical protein
VVFGERHLKSLNREYEGHYKTLRPHQGIGNRAIGMVAMPSSILDPPAPAQTEREERLGRLNFMNRTATLGSLNRNPGIAR